MASHNGTEKNRLKLGMAHYMIIVILAIFAVSISACTSNNPATTGNTGTNGMNQQDFAPNTQIIVQHFNSSADFENFLRQNSQESAGSGRGIYNGGVAMPLAASSPGAQGTAEKAVAVQSSPQGSNDYSNTNNQVAGIDEGDIIKTDGKYIYTITGNIVFIVNAYPADNSSVLSRISLNDTPRGIFVDGNRLAVFGTVGQSGIADKLNFTPRDGLTFIRIYDTTDKASPKLTRQLYFEGRYFDSRMIGSNMYILTRSQPTYRPMHPMPVMIDGSTVKESAASSIIYYPIHYDNPQFVGISAVNINDGSSNTKTAVVDGSQNVYMSNKSIYLSYTKYINEYQIRNKITISTVEPKLPSGDKQLIQKINAVDSDVLSQSEKQSKIIGIVNNYMQYLTQSERDALQQQVDTKFKDEMKTYKYLEYTVISKIGISGKDITFEANGKVPGRIKNQFSMDEYDNTLRIATTVDPRYDYTTKKYENASNHIYALDSTLNTIGSLDNVANGDNIQSTRFTPNRLYLTTYNSKDPFVVIDVTNPHNIKELGSLDINGTINYLQPYDDSTIVGLGRAEDTNGYQTGLKIMMYDVSDVSSPKLLASYTSGDRYANSIAQYEHHAFLLSKEKNLLVIPAYSYRYVPIDSGTVKEATGSSGSGGIAPSMTYTGYNGAFVFNISKSGIILRGLIDHSSAVSSNGYGYTSPAVERSLFINDTLYTKSPTLIRANALSDLHSIANITLQAKQQLPIPIY